MSEIPKEVIDLSGELEDKVGDNQSLELGTVNPLYNLEVSND